MRLAGELRHREKVTGTTGDLVDLADFLLASGLRIGEASAVTWDAVDLDAGTVEVRGTVVRIRGIGLRVLARPKSRSGFRVLELPGWAVAMLAERRRRMPDNEWNAVFTAPKGGLRDPSNVPADLRVVFAAAGYRWVTSHVHRKTVATTRDAAGPTPRQAADRLGHAKVSMTQGHHFGRKVARTGAAQVLELFAEGPATPRNSGGRPGA